MHSRRNSRAIQRVPHAFLRLPAVPVQANPRKQIEKTKKFLAEFDQIPLIYAGPDGEILCGEEIWLALKMAGATEVDVVIIDGKSPAELRAIRLALHRLPADAKWIDQNVKLVLEELESVDFDLDLTGFDAPEIDGYLNLDLPKANLEESGEDIPPLETKTISAPGTVWSLPPHRVGCGSATDLAFIRRVLGGQTAAMCFTDPPYNLKASFISGKGRHQHPDFVQGSGEMSRDEYIGFTCDWLSVVRQCCLSTALIYSCTDWRHLMEMTVAGYSRGMELYQIVTWVKSNGGMGGIYRNQSEFICVFRAGKDTPRDNVELGRRGRNRTNVWNYPGMSSFGKERDNLLGLHPTIKPVGMIADAMRDVTKRGEIILDCFLGSGSSLMAADETGRICCGIELDPRYVDLAVRRWQNANGREAVLLSTGERFNAFAERRLAGPSEPDLGK